VTETAAEFLVIICGDPSSSSAEIPRHHLRRSLVIICGDSSSSSAEIPRHHLRRFLVIICGDLKLPRRSVA
jgi:hypothetical protein